MEKKVFKYPEIGKFRNAITSISGRVRYVGKDENGDAIFNDNPLPTIRYKLTPKGHGSNCGIVWNFNPDNNSYDIYTQSRERIITPMNDNHGFSTNMHRIGLDVLYDKLALPLLLSLNDDIYFTQKNEDGTVTKTGYPTIIIYGEWSGKGIQKKVGISKVDKFFMIFGIKVNGIWIPDDKLKSIKLPEMRIFNVLDYKSHEIDIDFNNPQNYTEQFDKWVEEIENECPISLALGIENGIGEGWVAKPVDRKWHSGRFFFKIKGDKHKGKGDKNKKVQIDPVKLEKIKDLVDEIVDEGRLEQGVFKLKENNELITIKSMGKFLKWLGNDTVKEELDTIISNGFEPKEITKHISNKGRKWFMDYLDKEAGL